jgi:hypothetical protein
MQNDVQQPGTQSRRQRVAHCALSFAWVTNTALLFAAFAWTYYDGRLLLFMDVVRHVYGLRPAYFDPMIRDGSDFAGGKLILFAAFVAACTFLAMLVGLFVGERRFRTMRAWLLFVAVAGGWLGFIVAAPEVYWRGQQRRLRPMLGAVESMAQELQVHWPREDGDMPSIGPFLAYPQGKPTCLLPLKLATFPNTALRFSAVERTPDGAMRFELAGKELGAWLEWRADELEPTTFMGGLDTKYEKGRHIALEPRWFLVRYQSVPFPFSIDVDVESF